MRFPSLVALCICAVINTNGSANGQEVVLVNDGQPAATIYVNGPLLDQEVLEYSRVQRRRNPVDPAAEARTRAVTELNYHLKKMTGAELKVVVTDDVKQVKAPAIVLGDLAVALGAKPQKTSESLEGFRILTQDNMVLIGGQSDIAAQHGTYTLLESLGCAWVMPGEIGEVIPQKKSVSIPATDISQSPDFLIRRLWYRGWRPRDPLQHTRMYQWLSRQRFSDWDSPATNTAGHFWNKLIKDNKEAFDADPTMYALVRDSKGEMVRRGPQIETTHPAVIDLIVKGIDDKYQANIKSGEWTAETAAGFPIGPADGLGYSMSSESIAVGAGRVDPIVGELDRTDELIHLANRVLEKTHKKYPNAVVGYYSYSTHADYPARYKPHPNVVQIFAPINFSRFHSVLDENSKTQDYYRDVVEQWSKLHDEQGNVLIYRGYNWNLAENMLPFSKLKIWGDEIPFYKQKGFIGLNVEATKSWSILGPSDYVLMKLAWDSTLPWKEVLHEYCAHAFGDGAEAVERYLLDQTQRQHAAGQEAGSYHAFHLIYDRDWIAKSQATLGEALSAAKAEPQKTRIQAIIDNVKALELYLDYHDATLAFDFVKAKQGYDAMMAHWQEQFDRNDDWVANEVPQYLKRFKSDFVEKSLLYSSAPYQIVHQIPDELPTMVDPNTVGDRMRFHSPDIQDDGFMKTKTYSTTWDAQGLGALRDTAVWYRVHFELPESANGQPIGLFIGSAEDEARVWINGKIVGTSGRTFSKPFLFDLTDGVKYTGDNLLAIQVVRNSKANEIGLGGIIRPSFIFAGPQLETKAPKPLENRRILPGGELGDVIE